MRSLARSSRCFKDRLRPAPAFVALAMVMAAPAAGAADSRVKLGGSDFETRCHAPGVVRCFGFDDPAKTDPYILHSKKHGQGEPEIDRQVKASGAGSLRFTIPSISGSGAAGSLGMNFSDDLSAQFGEGQEFYVQWRQRFSLSMLNTGFLDTDGHRASWKQIIIGEGDRPGHTAWSCTQLEVVVINKNMLNFPFMYHSCGGKDGQYQALQERVQKTGDYLYQNAAGCLRSLIVKAKGDRSRYIPPCVGYKPDQWMTFQVRIKIGTWYRNDRNYHRDSEVELWVADQGRPSRLVIDRKGYDLANTNPEARYGKVWLLPFMTHKDPRQVNPVARTWYDDLIVSRRRIDDPPYYAPDTTPPAPPAGLSADKSTTTAIGLSWQPARDAQSSVAYYNVFRDGSPDPVAQSEKNEYVDYDVKPGEKHRYRITAVNTAGLESPKSDAIAARTRPDVEPPAIDSVEARSDPNQVRVTFSEPVDELSARLLSNYRIGGLIVGDASLSPDGREVTLRTTSQVAGRTYTLHVANVKDRARPPNTIAPDTTVRYTFLGAIVLVEFGKREDETRFGLKGWRTLMMDRWTKYESFGPGGTAISAGRNLAYNFQGVRGDPRVFHAGDRIVVTWYNDGGSTVQFTPRVSFDDPDRPGSGTPGKWYEMSPTSVPARGTAVSRFEFQPATAGTYSLVNVNVNYANHRQILCHRIELVPAQGEISGSRGARPLPVHGWLERLRDGLANLIQ